MGSGKVVAGCACAFIILVIAMIVALVANSLKKLSSDQVGIIYDTINKDLDNEATTEGLHLGPVGFQFIIFPSVYKTLSFDDLKCLNADGVIITLDVTYQYKARAAKLYDIVMNFKDYDGYKKVLKYTGESAILEACSYFTTAQFQSERGSFQEQLCYKINEKYEAIFCDITDLQVSDISRPEEYERALRSKERAREDIQVASNERPRLITEAETEKREATTTAQIILDKANSDARILKARAAAEAEAIIQQYQKESEAYQQILSPDGLGFFIVDGFISYMGVRVISSAKNPVYIGLQSPAKSSYQLP